MHKDGRFGTVNGIAGKSPEVSEAEAIRTAVASRMEQLDEAFLVALGAFCNAAQQQGNIALAGRPSSALKTGCFPTTVLHVPAADPVLLPT